MLLLTLSLLLQPTPAPRTDFSSLRAMVMSATRAIEGDSMPRVERIWQSAAGNRRDPVALFGLATLARLTYRYAEADRLYLLLKSREEASAGAVHLYATLGLGLSLAARHESGPAARQLESAISEADILGDASGSVEARLALAMLVARSVGLDSARAILARVSAQVRPSDTVLVARARCAQASLLRGVNLRRADTLATEGLRLVRSTTDRRAIGACLVAAGQVAEAQGTPAASIDLFREAATLLEASGDRHALAAAQQWLAFQAVQYSATFWRGRDLAMAAITGGRQTGNRTAEAWARLNLAQLGIRLGDMGTALAHVDTARALFQRLGDRLGLANVMYAEGQAAMLAGRPAQAREAFRQADSLNTALGFTLARPGIALQIAATFRVEGRLEDAARALAAADESARRAQLPGIVHDAVYERGLLALARGQWDDAGSHFAEFAGQTPGTGWGARLDADIRRAEALAQAGRFAEAEDALDRGLHGLARRRFLAQYQDREGQLAILTARRFDADPDLGLATTVALFARSGRIAEAFRIAEGWRGHYLLAQMLRLRGASATAPGLLVPDSADIANLPGDLPDSTALLMFVAGQGGEPTTLFTVTRTGITADALPPADALVAPIARFQTALEAGSPARTLAAQLGRDLVAPALSRLDRSLRHLIIIPDGPLFRLAFDALILPDGTRLLERYGVSIAPSARLAARWWTRPGHTPGRGALVLGDPVFPPVPPLDRLPASGVEARAIARRFASPDLRLRGAASEAALKSASFAEVGLLHLATHASVSDLGLLSSGVTLAAGGGEDGHVGVGEIVTLRLNQALVVLSGCRTVGGVVVNGEGLQGLTTPFLEAGARTIVATQWAIGDRALARLMNDFYEAMATGAPVGDAARAAKLKAFRRGASPAVWGSLVVVGDPGLHPRVF